MKPAGESVSARQPPWHGPINERNRALTVICSQSGRGFSDVLLTRICETAMEWFYDAAKPFRLAGKLEFGSLFVVLFFLFAFDDSFYHNANQ